MTNIPKKPLAVSRAKKKLPLEIDWGKGIPKDRLRYINAREEALIKANRSTTAERSHMGVKAYADDSASSKGVSRPGSGTTTGTTTTKTSTGGGAGTGQGGQSRGPSGAGQGPNSASSGSKSPSSSSSGSKSPSSSSTSTGGGSNSGASRASSPNAAAQAASNKLNGYSGAARPTTNAGPSTLGGNKAPNMAASYASQKLNATAGALKAGQQPESIQGLINSQGQYAPNGSYYGPKGINSLNTSAYGAANRSPQTAANGSYYGPKGTNALNTDARYAAARSVGFNPDPVQRVTGDAERMGRMMMAESASIKNQYGNVSTPGLMGVGEVIRNRVLSDRFPNTVDSVMNQRKQFSPMGDGSFARTPANDTATRIAESILSGESPPTVGTSLNYGNLDTINNKPGYSSSKSKAAFNAMDVEAQVADYRNPKSFAHSFGTIGSPSDVSFNGFGTPSATTSFAATPKSPLQSAMDSWNPPQSSAIPAPTSTGMLPNTAAAARMAGLQQAPSQNMQQPTAPPAGLPGFTPQSGFTPQGLPSNFRGTAGVASTGRVPGWGYSPSADYSAPSAGTSLASSTPESYSPQAGPGDQVAGDAPEVVSDNPMQGSQNPMQEGENPQVKRDRQQKYASRGATIGGIVAGPLGTVVGGTLGWQMGKTPPRQQQAIASNPQALTANVKSINDMVEERGGKGNPQMQVTEAGFKDVLTNPAKVTKEPEKYTTLEQMLAALAQGVDPETGKPIT